ncbi:hypothetical protein GDO81_000948 [Engystomops pustulosus]|uniref:Uncharacterized protein n=1 Tax=Engystomops pustulosus TaxID=76066 RepID=A0AAV7D9H2_ENGPU|nr:hypothetical protein GDO81_000948 [Engystomops pustulosus]
MTQKLKAYLTCPKIIPFHLYCYILHVCGVSHTLHTLSTPYIIHYIQKMLWSLKINHSVLITYNSYRLILPIAHTTLLTHK